MDHGIRVSTVSISAPDALALAIFYAALLGWEITDQEPGWVMSQGRESIAISVEEDASYQRPVWPTEPDRPPMQLHLEVRVTDLQGAVEHAVACGATMADVQPQEDVRVCLDPAGHPFCLWLDTARIRSGGRRTRDGRARPPARRCGA